ncbi:MAG: sigma-70 family RNA polymerase sigma factor [Gaiellaceae bacterium]
MDDTQLVKALRAGDRQAYEELVERYTPSLLRVASLFTPTRAVAEEVVQDTWVGVLRGIEGFEGRSSLKTWLFRILTNTAKTRGARERRTLPFSALAGAEVDAAEPVVDADRFDPHDGHWSQPPAHWPEERLLAAETRDLIRGAIDGLPPAQRVVVSLRDVEGWSSEEVRDALGLTEINQRVLLHRGRAKVRTALEAYLA